MHDGRVPAEADLICYWFEKAGRQIASGKAPRAGLVATNSIRAAARPGGRCKAATDTRRIFEAWGDEPWVIDGAAVGYRWSASRVSATSSCPAIGSTASLSTRFTPT